MQSGVGTDSAVISKHGRCRRGAGGSWRRHVSAFLILTALLGWAIPVLEAAPAASAQDFATAWKAYRAAVRRKAPASELLPLAQAVYDALPADPQDPKMQKRKAAAAFNLGAALRDVGRPEQAYRRFKESLSRFEKALGKNALALVDPLWELARLDLEEKDRAVGTQKRVDRIDAILAGGKEETIALRVALHDEWATSFARYGYLERALAHVSWLEENAFRLGEQAPVLLGKAAFLRGKVAAARGEYRRAVKYYKQARDQYLTRIPAHDRRVLIVDQFLVVALERMGRTKEATPFCQEIGRYRPSDPNGDYMPLYRVMPDYPEKAINARVSGTVLISLTVTADGRTKDIRVVKAQPAGYFEDAALAAARQFRYAPRFKDGHPVDTPDVRYLFKFTLE